jgi:hypothetical protein
MVYDDATTANPSCVKAWTQRMGEHSTTLSTYRFTHERC